MKKEYRGYNFIFSILISLTLIFPAFIATKNLKFGIIFSLSIGIIFGIILEIYAKNIRPINKTDIKQIKRKIKIALIWISIAIILFVIVFYLSDIFYYTWCGDPYHKSINSLIIKFL